MKRRSGERERDSCHDPLRFHPGGVMEDPKPGWGSLGEEVHETPLREPTPAEIVERFLSQPDQGHDE